AFLRDLSSYYFAPIGEVMRLALPPVDRETARAVAEPSLFESPGGVADRRVQWVEATAKVEETGALRGQAAALLAHVRATGATPLAKLEERWKNARSAVKKLAQLELVVVEQRVAPDSPLFAAPVARDAPHEATPAQTTAVEAIAQSLNEARAATFLLH